MDTTIEKKLLGYKQIAREKLESILLTIFGKKDLVIEPDLIRPLDSFSNITWLRSKGVDKIFKFNSKIAPTKTKQLVYIISTNLLVFKHVLNQISAFHNHSSLPSVEGFKEYNVIVIPDLFYTFKDLLEKEGLYNYVVLHRFSFDFVGIDKSLLSLEVPKLFEELFLKNDSSLLNSIAASLRIFNLIHNKPNIIFTYGKHSEKIISMVNRMEKFKKRTVLSSDHNIPDFNSMIIIDRDKDYVSTLLTPVVYAGLLIELFESKTGYIAINPEYNKIKSEKLNFLKTPSKIQPKNTEILSLRMGGNFDDIYNLNKYRHFVDVVSLLSIESKNLEEEKKKYSRSMNIVEMKNYVETNLPRVTTQKGILYKHLRICELIVQELSNNFERHQNIEEAILTNSNRRLILSYIDELMNINAHKYNIIRLMCLCYISIDLQNDEVTRFINSFCNTFGLKYMSVFQNLITAKLFPNSLSMNKSKVASIVSLNYKKNTFQVEVNKLKLIPSSSFLDENIRSERNQTPIKAKKNAVCPSFVFNGNYIPLVAQIANIILKAENFTDIYNKLGSIEKIMLSGQSLDGNLKSFKDVMADIKRGNKSVDEIIPLKPKTMFIFVVGGITYAEIAACNLVEALTGSRIILASNTILSGSDVINSFF